MFLEESKQRRCLEIRDHRHAYLPGCLAALFYCHQYENRFSSFELAASTETGLRASDQGVRSPRRPVWFHGSRSPLPGETCGAASTLSHSCPVQVAAAVAELTSRACR